MGSQSTRRARGSRRDPTGETDLQRVLDSIRRIVRGLRLSARDAERRAGVSGAQLFVLQKLVDAPAESLNDLAARTHTHQSSVSVVVSRLVERRLVARTASTHDARRVTIALTAAGRGVLRKAPEAAQLRIVDSLERLPRGERRTLARLLEKLVAEMGMAGERPAMLFEEGNAAPRGPAGGGGARRR